jgi:hypothetical protein
VPSSTSAATSSADCHSSSSLDFLQTPADGCIARARSVDVHRWISAVALGLLAAHGLVLLGDPYVRFDAVDLLVPFVSAYRPLAMGLGVLAAYVILAVFGSIWLRGRIGRRAWRLVHYLVFPTLGLVTLHGLAGTDSASPWMHDLPRRERNHHLVERVSSRRESRGQSRKPSHP